MSVHYKFKSTLNFDTITFDGLHISVADLKREIVQQKRLGKIIDFDLQITNAQTKEEYKDDNFLIPKNTTLIISRIPVIHPVKKGWDPLPDNSITNVSSSKVDNFNMDLFKMQGSEEEKIQAMMMQSTADYDPKTYHRIKGQSQIGEVPATYRCNKCKRGGHWIKNCSFTSGKEQFELKRNTGIPRSFRGKTELSTEHETTNYIAPIEKEQDVPEDLICGICRTIFIDAVMIPCCGSSFCDDCVRNSLLESEDSECPDCKEKNCSPGSLIPNRFLRNSVNVFKNETGYKLGAFKSVTKSITTNDKKESLVKEQDEKPELVNVSQTNNIEDQSINKNIVNKNIFQKENAKDKFDSDYEDNLSIKKNINIVDNKEQVLTSYVQSINVNNQIQRKELNFDYKSDVEVKQTPYAKNDSIKPQSERSLLPTPIGSHHKYQNINVNEQRAKSVINSEQGHRIGLYKQPYIQMPRCPSILHISPYNNGYTNIPQRPPMNYGHYQNQPVHQISTSYMPPGNININPTQSFQSTNLASIYQGVAAKVGTGLIDDPLEAFNRIMKEKEKQKVERRRSPGHHRSRSPGRLRHRFKSPVYDRCSSRDNITNEKRTRSRERKREYSYEKRQSRATRHSSNGSNSPSDKKKRYAHRRPPSPKTGYKSHIRDKSVTKPYGTKTDTVEPPPPGFEALQFESLNENESNVSNKTEDSNINKSVNVQNLITKRPYSKSTDNKTVENNSRSLTPPTSSKSSKDARVESMESFQSSPITPGRREPRNEKINSTQLLNPDNMISAKSQEYLESNNNTGKENNITTHLQSKDKKKKKKDKSERKKNKKDKKDKKDKTKKGYSDSFEANSDKFADVIRNANSCDESVESFSKSRTKQISNRINHDALNKSDAVINTEVIDQDLNRDNLASKITESNNIQISKWELDDNILANNLFDPCKKIHIHKGQEHTEITSDVIRKAENAIFAKAINAIRPVEFKVVIDSKQSSKDAQISLKSHYKDSSHSPKSINKSVKERLGSKVINELNDSSERSKNRREDTGKNFNDSRSKHSSIGYNSRKKEKDYNVRTDITEKKIDDHKSRKSNELDFINKTKKNSIFKEIHKHKQQFKDKPTLKSTKSERKGYDSDTNAYKCVKTGEPRLISSIASRPCRPDNPFRKFDENISCSNKVTKFDSLIQGEISPASSDNSEYKKRKDKKLKKLKALKKCSSTESVKSEKQKDVKNKKKNKMLKKKKKSRK